MNESSPDDDALVQRLVASRALRDAPESLVLEAIALWDRYPRPLARPTLRRRLLSATLGFDSAASAMALAAVRSGDDARQLLFSIEGRDVDLRIKRSSAVAGAGWMVSGQVLDPDRAGRTSLRCGGFEAVVEWSDLCEFHIEAVPGGDCVVSLQTDEWEAVLPAFSLPAAS